MERLQETKLNTIGDMPLPMMTLDEPTWENLNYLNALNSALESVIINSAKEKYQGKYRARDFTN